MILDFGLNPQPFGMPTRPIPVKSRIIVNFRTAKRLERAINAVIGTYEKKHGAIETDVLKRVKTLP